MYSLLTTTAPALVSSRMACVRVSTTSPWIRMLTTRRRRLPQRRACLHHSSQSCDRPTRMSQEVRCVHYRKMIVCGNWCKAAVETCGSCLFCSPVLAWRMRHANDRNLLTPVSSLQGVFLVPGLFWFMTACTDVGGAGSAGSDMAACSDPTWCANGTQCDASPRWLVQKVQLYWEWALTEQGIHGFNTWHWADRPTMMPASFRRGAVSLGSELLRALQEVGRNITKAHPYTPSRQRSP